MSDSSRVVEARAVIDFLDAASAEPVALVVEGEAGIGKTTLWLSAVHQARERGFQVLSARPADAESVLAYASLADLLAEVDATILADLPTPQRVAVDRVLLRGNEFDAPTDQRAVAAGFLSVVQTLAETTPVLVAIDDLQWVDPSSEHVLAFAARRISARVAVLGAVRTGPDSGSALSWLRLPRPDAIRRIQVHPLTLGRLHAVISERLGRSFPRSTMVRIHEISGGNPFYALELAQAMDDGKAKPEQPLPGTLTELVRARMGILDAEVQGLLLAAACVPAPTMDLVARATDINAARAAELLEGAESKGIVGIDGPRLRFTHPLLARGVYTDAGPARRRAMHRRLAEIVEQLELRARHLALAATSADPLTLQSLDAAAEMAGIRGAPEAAAELLDLAIGLDGGTVQRQIRSASYHFNAGELERPRAVLEQMIETLAPGVLLAEALTLLAAVRLLDGSFLIAARLLERALLETEVDLAFRVQTTVTLSFALLNVGDLDGAARCIEDAVAQASSLGAPNVSSQALIMQVMVGFMRGGGVDEPNRRHALDLEDRHMAVPVTFRPCMLNAMLLSWTGQLDEARGEMLAIRQDCMDRGEESELMWVDYHRFLVEIWRGNLADANVIAADAMDRALLLGGDLPLSVASMIRAAHAAYAGDVDDARRDASEAIEASRRCGSSLLAEWPITIIGFLEVSLGNHQEALTTLEPMLAMLDPPPKGTEIFVASFVPDAAEALIQVGRLADAEPLIDMFERNGRRLDRAWMLATGARCRAMLLAANGELDAAGLAAQQAMVEHNRLPMPFERARTQLLVGQLQRRARQKDAAAATLHEALRTFERLGTPLWAGRARAELARVNVRRSSATELTPSEHRVAELAASGMTNRDVAAALFISPRTVEANLARVYRKLGIHSRAELGRHMGRPER
jgi:DNA-binding CsgD family transcriptional regulator